MDDIKLLKDRLSKYTILCVEDDEESLKNLINFFSILFDDVLVAKNGKEGLDTYFKNSTKINIIFTDINMPILSGYDMIKEIKEHNPLQYIVVMSAHQDLELYNNCLNLGLNGLIIKPIDSKKIIELLKKAEHTLHYIDKQIKQKQYLEKDLEQYHNDFGYDNLTKLPNKIQLDHFLSKDISYSLILVNIDYFDSINCKYGYKTGDQVIKRFSEHLSTLKIEYGCDLFRVVSDEFVLLFKSDKTQDIELIAKDIIQKVEDYEFHTDVDTFNLSCSIGISTGVGEKILKNANIALKETRVIGKEKFTVYMSNSFLSEKREDNLKWLQKIKKLIEMDAITPYYQPIINNQTKKIEFYECLARIHEINRVIKPHYFIENAKLFKLLPNITRVIVKKAFKEFSKNNLKLSINLSIDDLEDKYTCEYIIKIQKEYMIDPKRIILEFPENISTIDDSELLENFTLLQNNGFQIALDDFGTNHSNIKNLSSLKIDYIKIDSLYIQEMIKEEKTKKLVFSIVKLAHSLNAKLIAESVSSEDIQAEVEDMNIEYSQGYLFGKPTENLKG